MWRQPPRMRGRISARAEEPVVHRDLVAVGQAHLRASGGTRAAQPAILAAQGASPRERRNRAELGVVLRRLRRISARAEEPSAYILISSTTQAHLRASGGTSPLYVAVSMPQGASPRERRNRAMCPRRAALRGRISARAEEPRRWRSCVSTARAHLRASGGTQMTFSQT